MWASPAIAGYVLIPLIPADDLINILDACKILKLIKIKKEKINLDRKLLSKNQHEIAEQISKTIRGVEPFLEIIKDIRKTHGISTTELFRDLIGKE